MHGGFDNHVAKPAAIAVAAHTLDSLATQAEGFLWLCFGGDFDLGYCIESRNFDLATECCGGETDQHFTVQIVLFALEYGVCFEVNLHVEIAQWAAIDAVFALAKRIS